LPRPGTLNELIVNRELFARFDISCSHIKPVRVSPEFDADIWCVAVICEPIIVTAQDEPIQLRMDVAVMQHDLPEMRRLFIEQPGVEVEIKPFGESPNQRSHWD